MEANAPRIRDRRRRFSRKWHPHRQKSLKLGKSRFCSRACGRSQWTSLKVQWPDDAMRMRSKLKIWLFWKLNVLLAMWAWFSTILRSLITNLRSVCCLSSIYRSHGWNDSKNWWVSAFQNPLYYSFWNWVVLFGGNFLKYTSFWQFFSLYKIVSERGKSWEGGRWGEKFDEIVDMFSDDRPGVSISDNFCISVFECSSEANQLIDHIF